MAAAMAAAIPLDRTAGPFAVPNAFAANEPALPLVPRVSTPLKFSNEVPSRIIKGCWQLSGGHRGDPSSDRTSGPAAVDDFASFVNAGIDTFDTGPEACGYGPSELIIGEALKSGKISRDGESILFYVRTGNYTDDAVFNTHRCANLHQDVRSRQRAIQHDERLGHAKARPAHEASRS